MTPNSVALAPLKKFAGLNVPLPISLIGPLTVPNTGDWQRWVTISRAGIPLTAGPHVLRVALDTNGGTGWWGNLNYMRWTVSGAAPG